MESGSGEEHMRPFKRTAMVAALLPLISPVAWGLGLGDIKMRSFLNEPLKAEVALLDVQGLSSEDIRIRLATQEDFDRLGVERAYFLTSLQFDVVVDGDNSKIVLTTDQPLLEPYLDFLIETRWPSGRLLREYTVLVDLPTAVQTVSRASAMPSTQPEASPAAPAAVEPVATATQPTPRAKPSRRYDRDTEALPQAGGRYLVQANDTLWEIASAARPSGATVEQTMMATVAMNGDAFTGSNINGLKAGYVLELPGSDEIFTSRDEARAMFAQHNSDWAAGIRRAPALRVVADNEFEDSDDGAEPIDETGGVASTETVLASGDSAATESVEDEAGAVGATPSDVAVANVAQPSAELVEIQARLGQLSDQVDNLRQLVSVKDQQIASLQAQLAAKEQAQAAQPQPAPVVTAPAPQVTQSGLPWWVYALGGVVVLAIGGVIYARIVDKRFAAKASAASLTASQRNPVPRAPSPARADAPIAEPELEADLEPAPEAAPEPSDDGERGYGRKLHNDYAEENAVSDAIAEADIYVAYGRYQQALNLLASASKADPGNASAYLKMMDIYLKNDRHEEAAELLPQIEQTHDVDALKKAMAMLGEPAKRADAIDLGELAETPSIESSPQPELAPMEFDLVSDTKAADSDLSSSDDLPSLELDLSNIEPATEADAAEPELADWGEPEETGSDDNDRLPPELAAVLGTDVPPPSSDIEESDDDNKLVYATEADPMDTKLDLARAYIDMGDEEGARPVLEEVIAHGDLSQQAEARELLIHLD